MSKDIVHKATMSTGDTNNTKQHKGIISSTFNERDKNHVKSSLTETELSKHIWYLKQNRSDFTINWSILKNLFLTRGIKKMRYV